jgi:trypsin
MIKTIAALFLALATVPANAANISFDMTGSQMLPAVSAVEIPAHPGMVPFSEENPFARFDKARIVGGVQATPGEFPFIVSLQSGSFRHFCGGSLIRKNWVLTAAHCVEGGYLKNVVIGLHKQGDANVEKFTVLQIIKHPEWNSQTMKGDLALVKLSGDSKYAPIALNPMELKYGNFVTAGWGTTSEGGGVSSVLMKVEVPFVTQQACSAAYPNGIDNTMLCAGYPQGGKDSCQGDSGGPLILSTSRGKSLAGVVSWGEGCARPNKYGVYAKVNYALNWINSTAK